MSGDARPPLFPTLARSGLVTRIEDELRRAIVTGRLGPGARVVEVDIARQLGVSRAPVREAARRLESLGLLVSRSGHGFAVRSFSAADVEDLFPVRIQLERTSVELACARATDAQLAAFPRQVDAMVAQAASLPATALIARDLDFHVSIAEASGNRYLHRMLRNVQAELTVFLTLGAANAYDATSLAATHRPLAEALARRDVEAAFSALDLHLGDAWLHARRALGEPAAQTQLRPARPLPAAMQQPRSQAMPDAVASLPEDPGDARRPSTVRSEPPS